MRNENAKMMRKTKSMWAFESSDRSGKLLIFVSHELRSASHTLMESPAHSLNQTKLHTVHVSTCKTLVQRYACVVFLLED